MIAHKLHFLRFPRPRMGLGFALGAVGCTNGAPLWQRPPGQVAAVGQTTVIDLWASDPDGDRLRFDYDAPGLSHQGDTVQLTVAPDGHGLFTITPIARQVGEHKIDFIASDGRHRSVTTMSLDIRGVTDAEGAPVWLEPQGAGREFSLQERKCAVVPRLEVQDVDDANVTISYRPQYPGMELNVLRADGKVAEFRFCPTHEQVNASSRFDIEFVASDGVHESTKPFTFSVRTESACDMPLGTAPSINHTPLATAPTEGPIVIQADVADPDKGVESVSVLVWPNAPTPGNTGDAELYPMDLFGGTEQNGTWRAEIPNPGPGATMFAYALRAVDDDDPSGTACDNRTEAPANGTAYIVMLNEGLNPVSRLCQPCTGSEMCARPEDRCLTYSGGPACGMDCNPNANPSECPADYACSVHAAIDTSEPSWQCVKNGNSCEVNDTCVSDLHEPDDNFAQAQAKGVTLQGQHHGTICGGNPDHYLVQLQQPSRISVEATAPVGASLSLTTSTGAVIVSDTLAGDTHYRIDSACLCPAQYDVVVGGGTGSGPMQLNLTVIAGCTC